MFALLPGVDGFLPMYEIDPRREGRIEAADVSSHGLAHPFPNRFWRRRFRGAAGHGRRLCPPSAFRTPLDNDGDFHLLGLPF